MFVGGVRLAVQLVKLYRLETKKQKLHTSAPQTQKYVQYENKKELDEGNYYSSSSWGYNNRIPRK